MYQALYRKWRPQVFSDVVGQQHITETLMNEISTGRHSHAYLFTGSRGTGKTTCAKIFAKAVNCEHPVNGDPCNECETCKGIDSGSVMDVIEIDAASNNGVDNIREIRDESNFTPVSGKYRVYIIDEVHMLSGGAFNALLKTLEEPPEHVKFVLATTEVHKIPATILSRCQRFDFKRITPEDIASRLMYVAQREELQLSPEAATLIARLADGALRDALSILDQCISHSKNITADVVNETVGLAGKDYLFSLSEAILNNSGAEALERINELHNRSCDMERLCNELINHFRNLMVCKASKNPQNLIICSSEELSEYQQMADAFSMDRILEVLNVLGDTVANLRKGLNRRIETEMAIIRLCSDTFGTTVPVVKPVEHLSTVAEKTPIIKEAQAHQSTPLVQETVVASEPVVEHISLQETLPDGPIPTNVWNALIREVVSADKLLIGTMNGATAYKEGAALKIRTDNCLLKKFVPDKQHRDVIYNATFTVLGEYLQPMISELESKPAEKAAEAPIEMPIEMPIDTPVESSVETVMKDDINVKDIVKDIETQEIDPLDAFINSIQDDATNPDQINFNFFVEE